jgi:pimeloyl-ACP methyl ester carboxylesterase
VKRAWLIACTCLVSACASFQTGPSETLPDHERVTIAGRGQLRVLEVNPGAPKTVLLVHGYGASSASYKPVMKTLGESLRVIAVDLPGFGKSDKREGDYSPEALADVLAQILDQKGVQRAHVVGHSWGCSVALAFALRHKDRLDKLVLISSFVYDDQLLPMMRWTRASKASGDALYALFYRQLIGERLYLNFRDPQLVTEAVVDDVEASMARPGAVAAATQAARGMHFDRLETEYKKVEAPTLIVWGRDDRVARLPFGERLARDLPKAQLVVLPSCGHIPMWECTGETTLALKGFLE